MIDNEYAIAYVVGMDKPQTDALAQFIAETPPTSTTTTKVTYVVEEFLPASKRWTPAALADDLDEAIRLRDKWNGLLYATVGQFRVAKVTTATTTEVVG